MGSTSMLTLKEMIAFFEKRKYNHCRIFKSILRMKLKFGLRIDRFRKHDCLPYIGGFH